MSKACKEEKSLFDFLQPLEKLILKGCHDNSVAEIGWKQYLITTKNVSLLTAGSLKTEDPTFEIFPFAVIIIQNALSLFVSLILGPINKHFLSVGLNLNL
jgi:K+-transporting ATPase A subunit